MCCSGDLLNGQSVLKSNKWLLKKLRVYHVPMISANINEYLGILGNKSIMHRTPMDFL